MRQTWILETRRLALPPDERRSDRWIRIKTAARDEATPLGQIGGDLAKGLRLAVIGVRGLRILSEFAICDYVCGCRTGGCALAIEMSRCLLYRGLARLLLRFAPRVDLSLRLLKRSQQQGNTGMRKVRASSGGRLRLCFV